MDLYDVYATSDAPPVNPGDVVSLTLVASRVSLPTGAKADEAITKALERANLAQVKLGGLVAIPSYGFTLKNATVTLTDPPATP